MFHCHKGGTIGLMRHATRIQNDGVSFVRTMTTDRLDVAHAPSTSRAGPPPKSPFICVCATIVRRAWRRALSWCDLLRYRYVLR